MALLSLFKRRKELKPAPAQQISLPPPPLPRHIDDLTVPAPSIADEKQPEKMQETAQPMLLFPEMPKEEEKKEVLISPTTETIGAVQNVAKEESAKQAETKPEIEEIPETLPDIEEVPSMKPEFELPEMPEIQITQRPETIKTTRPVFVNVEDYKVMLEELSSAKAKLVEFVNAPARLTEIKTLKDNSYERWRNLLEDVERKLLYLDKTIFEGG